jgi:hypothetical protein
MVSEFDAFVVGGYLCFVAFVVLYIKSRGYFEHRQKEGLSAEPTSAGTPCAPTVQPVAKVPTGVPLTKTTAVETAPVVSEPAPIFTQAFYETVQPIPAPAHTPYSTTPAASFGTAAHVKKPVQTYRRRPAPVRSTSAFKAPYGKSRKR